MTTRFFLLVMVLRAPLLAPAQEMHFSPGDGLLEMTSVFSYLQTDSAVDVFHQVIAVEMDSSGGRMRKGEHVMFAFDVASGGICHDRLNPGKVRYRLEGVPREWVRAYVWNVEAMWSPDKGWVQHSFSLYWVETEVTTAVVWPLVGGGRWVLLSGVPEYIRIDLPKKGSDGKGNF